MTVKLSHDSSVTHWEHAVKEPGDPNLTALSQAVLDEVKNLDGTVTAPSGVEAKLTAALPLGRAIDALAAAGMHLPKDTAQQKKIGQALHSSGVVIKHLINTALTPTGLPPTAV